MVQNFLYKQKCVEDSEDCYFCCFQGLGIMFYLVLGSRQGSGLRASPGLGFTVFIGRFGSIEILGPFFWGPAFRDSR